MQQELFLMPFTCSVMESINWTPIVEKNIAYNLSITYKNNHQPTNLFPNFASYNNYYSGESYAEFLVSLAESPDLAEFISNSMRKGSQEKKYCFVFYTEEKKYLIHDPALHSIKLETSPNSQNKTISMRIELLCDDIDIF